jgi:hypothetical protein
MPPKTQIVAFDEFPNTRTRQSSRRPLTAQLNDPFLNLFNTTHAPAFAPKTKGARVEHTPHSRSSDSTIFNHLPKSANRRNHFFIQIDSSRSAAFKD